MDPNDMSSSDLAFYLQHDQEFENKKTHKFILDENEDVSSEKFEPSQEPTKNYTDQTYTLQTFQEPSSDEISSKITKSKIQIDNTLYENLQNQLMKMRENSASSQDSKSRSRSREPVPRKPQPKKAPPKNIFKRRDERSSSQPKKSERSSFQKPAPSICKQSRGRTLQKPALEKPRTASSMARLAELCPEDKAKIGELVKKLAEETKQKQEFMKKYEEMESKMKEYEESQSKFNKERESMSQKFSQSLQMLQELKKSHMSIEKQNKQKDKIIEEIKERHDSQTRELKKSLKTENKKDEAAENAKKALDEIQSLKSEIQKLTQSLSCKQSEYTQKHEPSEKIKTDRDFPEFRLPEPRQETDRTSSKFSMNSSQKFGFLGKPMHIESLDCLQMTDRDEDQDQFNTLQPEKDMLKSFLTENKKNEEIENIEKELKQKLDLTSKLLDQQQESKTSLKNKSINQLRQISTNISEERYLKLKQKAIHEMGSNSSEDEKPDNFANNEVLREKQKQVDLIKQRFNPSDFYPVKQPKTLVSSNGSSNNYQRLIQQQREKLRGGSRSKSRGPEAPNQDSDDELAFMLNSKSSAIKPKPQTLNVKQQEPPRYINFMERAKKSQANDYNSKLFDVIDQMEGFN